jgi:hypothetical protein
MDEKKSRIDSHDLLHELAARKIQTRSFWQLIHRFPGSCPFQAVLLVV